MAGRMGWGESDLDKVRGTAGTGSCRTQRSQQGQGIQPSAGVQGLTTLRPRVDKRAQKGRENPRPSIPLLPPLGKLKPKEDKFS